MNDAIPPFPVGAWLKARRRELDLTQDMLADQVNCSPDFYRKIEAGTRKPSRQLAELLAERLSIPTHQTQDFILFVRGQLPSFPTRPATAPFATATGSEPASSIAANPQSSTPNGTNPQSPIPDTTNTQAASRKPQSLAPAQVPTPITAFIGREQEEAAVYSLLKRPGVRLLTLTGPPGTGKTRISLQVANDVLNEYSGNVYFVPLAPISDHLQVVPAIARTLGIKGKSHETLLDDIKLALKDKTLLLVLDNFEQVTQAGPLVADILSSSPNLKALVTSREALNLYGEYEFPVPPMSMPLAGGDIPFERLGQFDAIRLFAERALAVRPNFGLDQDNAPTIVDICRKVEGLPLAIELAAAQARHFSPTTILAKLDTRLELLAVESRNLPARQRTLWGAIDWSYTLLDQEEQRLFSGLGIFRGGWTLDAAWDICADPGWPRSAVQYALMSLVSKNLVLREVDHTGETRYSMLESIREFAYERLESEGELSIIEARHATFYSNLAEAAEPNLRGWEQNVWFARLDADHSNLREALRWASQAINHPDARELGLRTCTALTWYWHVRGLFHEGRQATESLLNRADLTAAPTTAACRALYTLGRMISQQGDHPTAMQIYLQARSLAEHLNDKPGLARALLGLSDAYYRQGDYAKGKERASAALSLYRELGNLIGICDCTFTLGHIALREGRFEESQAFISDAVAIAQQIGDESKVADGFAFLARLSRDQGDDESAQKYCEQSLVLYRNRDEKTGIAASLDVLARIMLRKRNPNSARTIFKECLQLYIDMGNRMGMTWVLIGVAGLSCLTGEWETAITLLAAAELLFSGVARMHSTNRAEFDSYANQARSHLTPECADHAWRTGRNMTLEEALALGFHILAKEPHQIPSP